MIHTIMIPKLLHYVWLSGDPLPELMQRCRTSWEKWASDYTWVLWDRQKVESIDNQWLRQTLETGKYAFATDFIRIYALYHHGGIYLDGDVELIGSLDPFLENRLFIGTEYYDDLEPAVFGSLAGHPLLKDLLDYYSHRNFTLSTGRYNLRPLPLIFNEKASRYGFKICGKAQSLNKGIEVFPSEYFSPKNLYFKKIRTTGSTVAIHHLASSWVDKGCEYRIKIIFHQLLFIFAGKRLHSLVVAIFRKLRG